jgi:glycosyltransferase involved in cell wall biosynthesis
MKLLIVSFPCVTPINQQFYAQVETLSEWDVTLVAPGNWKSEYGHVQPLKRWPEFQGRLLPIPVFLSGNIPLHTYRSLFLRLLREEAPDAIYVHSEPYSVSAAQVYLANWMSKRVPIGFYSAQNIHKHYPPPFRWSEQFVYRTSSFCFPVTQDVLDVMTAKGFSGEATILPLGIDPEVYTPAADDTPLRAELGADDQTVLLGYLGRLVEEKGLATLLDALARVPHLPWRLAVIGSGDYAEAFDAKAEQLGMTNRIERVGYVAHPEAPRYLSAFDALVLPSETRPQWKEQFGRVVIEALACGTAVIGSDSGEIPRLIEATEGGLVFPEGDADALATTIEQFILSPSLRDAAVQRGRTHVLAHYTLSSLADRFVRTIENQISTRRSAAPASMS